MASKIELEIVTLLEKATKDVAKFSTTTQKQLSSIDFKGTVVAINQGFELIKNTAGKAFGAIEGFVSDAIDEAVEGEQAMAQLANAMRTVGDFSEEAKQEFSDFASEVQKATTFSDDAVLSAAALAKNYGLTNRETRLATEAAIEYAAATGSTLDEAISKVGKSFTGFVDRDLGRLLPALKGLSKEQLIVGEGARLIQERFAGSSAALGDTFQGALSKTRNAFNDLLETIGKIIIENPVLIDSIKIIGNTFGSLSGEVDKNRNSLGQFVGDAIKGIVAITPATIQALKGIDSLLSSISNLFQATGKLAAGFFAAVQAESEGNSDGAKEAAQASIREIEELYRSTQERQRGFYDPLIKSAQDASDKIQELNFFKTKGKPIELKFSKSEAEITSERIKSGLVTGGEEAAKALKEVFDKQKADVAKIASNPLASIFPEKQPGDARAFTPDAEKGIATGVGALGSILGGAAGAGKLVEGLGAAAADAIVPGLGAAVGPIIGELAKGPEFVKQQVQEFAKAIPVIIKNIVLAIPVLIEELAKAIPQIVEELVDALPQIIEALVQAMPKVGLALAIQAPKIAIAFVKGIIENIPEIVSGFVDGLISAAGEFVNALIDAINPFDGGGLFGGGEQGALASSGIPIIEDIGSFLGLAEGGSIPDRPKFRGDGFGPVRLDAGEEVLSKDLSNKLRQALDGGGLGGQMPDINVTLLAPDLQQWARVSLKADQLGYRSRVS